MKLTAFERRVLRNFHEGRESLWGLSTTDVISRLPGTLVKLGRDGLLKGEELTLEGRIECTRLFETKRKLWCYCHACGHEWVALNLPIPLSEAGAELVGKYDCEKCGSTGYLAPKTEGQT